MNILITGANFYNKGAQLMLLTLIDSLNHYLPNASICVSPLVGNRESLQKLNVKVLDYPLFHYGNKRYFYLSMNFPLLTKLILKIKGINIAGDIPLNKINMVMDISGFAFGDKWGNRPLHHLASFVKKIKKQKGNFILMPQALGSFSNNEMVKDVNKIVDNADLIIARDKQSFSYVIDALGSETSKEKVFTFPDITLTYKKDIALEESKFVTDYCVIVPNDMMLRKSSDTWKENYLSIIDNILDIVLKNSNLNVILLIHAQGGSGDAKIGQSVVEKVSKEYADRMFYYEEENPLKLKAIIAKAHFIVGSRFHALASALSSNVPSISTSWLHKYEMLFMEYNCTDFNFKEPNEAIYERTKELLNNSSREKIVRKLKKANVEIGEKNVEMWKLILDKLKYTK